MAGDEPRDDRTVPLTKQMREKLAQDAKQYLDAPPADATPPVSAPAAPVPSAEGDATEPIDADRKAELQEQAKALIAEEQQGGARVGAPPPASPGKPKTRVAFTSSQIKPVGDDLLPFDVPGSAPFDEVADTAALAVVDDEAPPSPSPSAAAVQPAGSVSPVAPPSPAEPPAPASAEAPSPPPPASPTQFDIDIATSHKNQVPPTPPPVMADVPLTDVPLTGVPPTASEQVELERNMAKTAFVNMQEELSDGTAMLKLLGVVAVVVLIVVAIGVLMSR